jgi:hypothetical protein
MIGQQLGGGGLCEQCKNVRVVNSRTGSTFYRCQLANTDSRFVKYPPIPVLRCSGFAPRQP